MKVIMIKKILKVSYVFGCAFAYSSDAQLAGSSSSDLGESTYTVRLELNPDHTMLRPIIECFEGGCIRPYMRFNSIPGKSFGFDEAVRNISAQLSQGQRKELCLFTDNLNNFTTIESFGDSRHCDSCLGLRASVELETNKLLTSIFGALNINNELVFSDAASVASYS